MRPQPLISGYAQGLPWYAWQGTDRRQPGTTDAWELIGTGLVDLQAALSVALAVAHLYINICRHARMLLSSMYVLLVLYNIILFIGALPGLNLMSFCVTNSSGRWGQSYSLIYQCPHTVIPLTKYQQHLLVWANLDFDYYPDYFLIIAGLLSPCFAVVYLYLHQ